MLDAGPGNPSITVAPGKSHWWVKGPGPGLESHGGEPGGRGRGGTGPWSQAIDEVSGQNLVA